MADTSAVIMTSVAITTGTTLVAEQQDSNLSFKPIVGGWILGLILFVVATFAEDLARMFAILIMVTALLVNGSRVFGLISKVTTGSNVGIVGLPRSATPNTGTFTPSPAGSTVPSNGGTVRSVTGGN